VFIQLFIQFLKFLTKFPRLSLGFPRLVVFKPWELLGWLDSVIIGRPEGVRKAEKTKSKKILGTLFSMGSQKKGGSIPSWERRRQEERRRV